MKTAKIVALILLIIAVGVVLLFNAPITHFIKQLIQADSYRVRYIVTSEDINAALIITLLDGSGNEKKFYTERLPFSMTYTMHDGDKAQVVAYAAGTGTLYCHIDLDTTISWRYSFSSGKNTPVTCIGIVGQK